MDVPLSPKSRYRWVRSVSVARRSVKQRHSCKAEYGIFSSATRYWTSASFAGWLRWRKAPPFPFVSMRSNKWMPPRKLRRSLKSSLEHWWKSTWECGDAVSCRETLRPPWPNISKPPPPGVNCLGLRAKEEKAKRGGKYGDGEKAIKAAATAVRLSIDAIKREGLRCQVITGGGTGTYMFEGLSRLWTELQCGSYIFMDGEYSAIEGSDGEPYAEFEQSLFVLTTVMSTAVSGRAIVDAGLKSYPLEKGLPAVHSHNDMRLVAASDEHGVIALDGGAVLPLGTTIKLAPSHCDPTVNLHDSYICVRNGRVEALWPISARGASS